RAGQWIRTALTPARTLSLAFLTLGGFVAGVFFWGGFNTALEATNTEKCCVSCHEMKINVFEELKGTIHFTNRSGVRATCPDCHVQHNWTDKIARKMQASKEVWGPHLRLHRHPRQVPGAPQAPRRTRVGAHEGERLA